MEVVLQPLSPFSSQVGLLQGGGTSAGRAACPWPAAALAPLEQPVDSELSGSLVQKTLDFPLIASCCNASLESPRGVEQAACSVQLLLVQAPKAVGLQLIYWEACRKGKRRGSLVGGEDWQVLRSQLRLEKLMGHPGEGDRAGCTALPPFLPWNVVFIYGSLFLWGNYFCRAREAGRISPKKSPSPH